MFISRRELERLGETIGDMTCRKLGKGYVCHGGGKSKAPRAPDYTGAAQATAAGNLDAARVAAKANRVSQYTPYGNLVYTQSPTDQDVWSATQTLSPAEQSLLDQQNRISIGLGSTMDKGLGYVNEMLGNRFDTRKLPAEQINAGQTVQDAIMARLQPQLEREQAKMQTQMANQGISQGTEAYKNAEEAFRQTQNDRLIQAALQGMQTGQQARQQSLQEQAFLRNEPLNTLNAVRTGAQVQNPSFVNPVQQSTTQGPDLLGAAQQGYNAQLGQYNAQQAGKNNLMGGLFSLGGAAMMSPWAGTALGF